LVFSLSELRLTGLNALKEVSGLAWAFGETATATGLGLNAKIAGWVGSSKT
jgi:hypothetical protein